jgi:hypothetical protein
MAGNSIYRIYCIHGYAPVFCMWSFAECRSLRPWRSWRDASPALSSPLSPVASVRPVFDSGLGRRCPHPFPVPPAPNGASENSLRCNEGSSGAAVEPQVGAHKETESRRDDMLWRGLRASHVDDPEKGASPWPWCVTKLKPNGKITSPFFLTSPGGYLHNNMEIERTTVGM